MNKERSYFDLSQGATNFDPEMQSDADIEAIIRALHATHQTPRGKYVNTEQAKSAVRWFISTFGGALAGWFAAKGWFTIDQVMGVLNSPTVLSIAASLIAGVWGLFVHTQTNAVAVVDTIAKQPDSPVKAVVVEPTAEGKALAETMPGNTTVVAGTVAAANAAEKS